jgi:hypothetical protein
MPEPRLWSRYVSARAAFERDPSPRNEGAVVASYADGVRCLCPDSAHCLTLLCRNLANLKAREAA